MLPIAILAATSFFGPSRGPTLETQLRNFDALSGTGVVARVYARRPQAEMVVVGNAAVRQADQRPWHPIGRVAAPSTATIGAAIEVQRKLLVDAARGSVKSLRPLKDVSLAWSTSETDEAEDNPQLGSFRCTHCGAFNLARAEACTSCGVPRGDAPRGSLTMAMRTKALDADCCGFMPLVSADAR